MPTHAPDAGMALLERQNAAKTKMSQQFIQHTTASGSPRRSLTGKLSDRPGWV